jgi:hypothetical protein
MKKYYLALPLLLSVSITSQAMSITNGKVISHQEIIPMGATASFKDIDRKIPDTLLKFKNNRESENDYVEIDVKVKSAPDTVTVGDDIYVFGGSNVQISNFSDSPHSYTIKTDICDVLPGTCYSTVDVITLESGGRLSLDRSPEAKFVASQFAYYAVRTSIQEDNKGKFFRSQDFVMVTALPAKNKA